MEPELRRDPLLPSMPQLQVKNLSLDEGQVSFQLYNLALNGIKWRQKHLVVG